MHLKLRMPEHSWWKVMLFNWSCYSPFNVLYVEKKTPNWNLVQKTSHLVFSIICNSWGGNSFSWGFGYWLSCLLLFFFLFLCILLINHHYLFPLFCDFSLCLSVFYILVMICQYIVHLKIGVKHCIMIQVRLFSRLSELDRTVPFSMTSRANERCRRNVECM